ncbi:ABC transporter ATP-binding protein [Lactobacillus helveticus]|jgi:ABC-2 type transport system ATP-binding protein|uniref:Sodium extrusion ABC transporter, ATP-binding protein NatA n=5 Tax=Lactobacillus helveticus TaxID=1587 RepID=U4QM46_LACHE|nr:ABC transporter ATP-binding protein [Lactobacillus helveticus]ABX27192.1 ABC transporter ATPase component [Lactobacillus helveticus DPC 4571]ADX70237.1 ABC transporter ATPase component [Lactobacillus helveticus H10]ALI52605.1 ABC transporter ATPase [Lactobacillus helveticus]AUI74299.1 ABC transporter ATP-binding protein [Lactobacillus helveticus]AUI76234.1 ABC transporter ATP-binding protein [Lactobacillus helveticus]
MTEYLSIKNLRKVYNDNGREFIALDDVSFNINRGEIVALLGPNGAGKTTIVSIIGGYLLPTSGSVIVDGQDIIKSRSRDNIGVSFGGDLGFYGRATAKQNLSFFADLAKIPYRKQKKEIERVLDLVDLTSDMNNKVQFFSKGMKQRMHIARALLGDPKLILLDEPTDGLDVEIATNIRKVIKDLAQTNTSILLTSHMMSEVEALSNQIILLGAGKIYAKGTVEEIIEMSNVKRIDRPATLEESYLALAPKLRR